MRIGHGYDAHRFCENKELVIVPGASHTDLYDRLDAIPFDRLAAFFRKHMGVAEQ